ncbi:MAG TPA: DUF1549 domain-containing protein, partial [Pirellulaceae bacterium]|nr:DUF1549 domain-containing protein [Pirellulaceae bacterium]
MRFRFTVLTYALAGGVLAAGWAAAGLDLASPFAKQADAADNAKKTSNNGKSNGKDNDKNGGKGGGKNAKSNKSGAKSGVAASLPPLKTADDKLEFLEKIHRSFPARKVDTAFKVEELDRNLRHFMALPPEKYAPPASDETLVRRIYLDLTGRLPDGDTVKAYVADQSVAKRAKLVDKLLDSPEFGKYWGRYWRNVIFQKATTMNKRRVDPQALEDWLAKEFNKNEGWDR